MSAELALPGLPLRAEKVTAGYGGDPVIRDITLSADPGEVVSLVGPNGSGKSTLLKSLAGVVHVSSGTVRVGGLGRQLRGQGDDKSQPVLPVQQLGVLHGPIPIHVRVGQCQPRQAFRHSCFEVRGIQYAKRGSIPR